jgi:hypothetical protein
LICWNVQAIIAASAKKVQIHTLDLKISLTIPAESNKIPAGQNSFMGAMAITVLYPRWFNAFQMYAGYRNLVFINMDDDLKSGTSVILGR